MMAELTHMSLFTGIGGLDLASEMAGFTTVGQCEFADYPYRVLQKHWPNISKWKDVHGLTAADFTARTGLTTVTILSGGFPCQPHSVAGKRKASADERDLWPEFRRVIGEIKPRWVVAENVPGLLTSEDGRFFRGILRDFAEMGFDVGWCTYGACDVGAPHRRERIGIVAYGNGTRKLQPSWSVREFGGWAGNGGEDVADTGYKGVHERGFIADAEGDCSGQGGMVCDGIQGGDCEKGKDVADTDRHGTGGNEPKHGQGRGIVQSCETLADTDSQRGCLRTAGSEDAEDAGQRPDSQGESGKFESCMGGVPDEFSNWLDGLVWPAGYGAQQYDWEPPRTAHGVKHRADRIKCLGNAVVPAQFYPIFRAIAELEGL